MSILTITNGASGIAKLNEAGIDGAHMSWDDVLYDGPVPGGYPLRVLSELRARFIASAGWGGFDEIHAAFQARDARLTEEYDEVVLCFEHDLYDQLQLIQLLALFQDQQLNQGRLSLAYPPTYIGMCSAEQITKCHRERKDVSQESLQVAHRAWQAFTAESPEELENELRYETPELPHLQDALRRLAEEYPDVQTELSKTEDHILQVLAGSSMTLSNLFRAVQEKEQAIFMGDSSFLRYFKMISEGPSPLVQFEQNGHAGKEQDEAYQWRRTVSISASGLDVLQGRATKSSYVTIDRWIGGTHVNVSNPWRWDAEASQFLR